MKKRIILSILLPFLFCSYAQSCIFDGNIPSNLYVEEDIYQKMYEKFKLMTPSDSNWKYFDPRLLLKMSERKEVEDAGLIKILFWADTSAKPFIIHKDSVIYLQENKCWFEDDVSHFLITLQKKEFTDGDYFIFSFKNKSQKRALVPILSNFIGIKLSFDEEEERLDVEYTYFDIRCGE